MDNESGLVFEVMALRLTGPNNYMNQYRPRSMMLNDLIRPQGLFLSIPYALVS